MALLQLEGFVVGGVEGTVDGCIDGTAVGFEVGLNDGDGIDFGGRASAVIITTARIVRNKIKMQGDKTKQDMLLIYDGIITHEMQYENE